MANTFNSEIVELFISTQLSSIPAEDLFIKASANKHGVISIIISVKSLLGTYDFKYRFDPVEEDPDLVDNHAYFEQSSKNEATNMQESLESLRRFNALSVCVEHLFQKELIPRI